ncbi:HEAT repeat domain-containing protein [Tenacibaculum ovolyticum]|uniref:HEAT repeat domain-containing protein n=1 Tax=Tenacibaculum ovolyticum TaxID=104270 RepID=UPI0003FAF482|nr:HEAT repeat domain-containing protein [Tenacibaculum ovolyticum]
MKFNKKNLNNIEDFLEKFSEKYSCFYESFYEIRKGRKLSVKIGKKIGSDLTKLEKINEQIWEFTSIYSWNFTSFLCSSLWNTDEVLHKDVSTFVNKILLNFNKVSDKKTEPEVKLKKEIDLKKLKKDVDASPYTVFWEAKSILPTNNDKEGCLEVILKALSNIDDDIDEHDTSNYNSYFEPVNEDEPCYDEHLEYQEHYINLLKKVKATKNITQKEFEYTSTIEVNKHIEVINIDTHESDHDGSYYISFLSSIYWDTPEKYRKNIHNSFHKSLDQFNNRSEKPISIELLKARNNTYDSLEIAQLLIDYANSLWENVNKIYKFNYVIEIINKMPLYGQEVKNGLANELEKKQKISEIKKYLDFLKESSFHFFMNHEKVKNSLIKKVSQTKGNRITVIQQLAYFNDEEVQQTFINCLNDSNPTIVYHAIKALSYQKNLALSIHHIKELFLNSDQLEYHLKNTIYVFSKIKNPLISEFLTPLKKVYIKDQIRDSVIYNYKVNINSDVNLNTLDKVDFNKFYSDMLWSFNLVPTDIYNINSYDHSINGMNQLVLDHWKCKLDE